MRIDDCLKITTEKLQNVGITTFRLDALVLLEDATDKDRAWLLAHPEHELTDAQVSELNELIERRAKHEPLAYIRGKSEFYGREFIVNEHTLEPRPETETIIELLKKLLKIEHCPLNIVVDVGTGSGCLAITAKLEFPNIKVYGTDTDNKCTQVAELNAKKHSASIDFRQGNLLGPFKNEKLSDWAVLANLPYVPDDHAINTAATFEPKHAIFGGKDGLELYREMFEQIDKLMAKPTHILTESLPFQHEELAKIAARSDYKQVKEDDFIQVFSIS